MSADTRSRPSGKVSESYSPTATGYGRCWRNQRAVRRFTWSATLPPACNIHSKRSNSLIAGPRRGTCASWRSHRERVVWACSRRARRRVGSRSVRELGSRWIWCRIFGRGSSTCGNHTTGAGSLLMKSGLIGRLSRTRGALTVEQLSSLTPWLACTPSPRMKRCLGESRHPFFAVATSSRPGPMPLT